MHERIFCHQAEINDLAAFKFTRIRKAPFGCVMFYCLVDDETNCAHNDSNVRMKYRFVYTTRSFHPMQIGVNVRLAFYTTCGKCTQD